MTRAAPGGGGDHRGQRAPGRPGAASSACCDYGYPVRLVCTPAGARVWREELDADLGATVEGWRARGDVQQLPINDIGAAIASGGLATAGMLVVPCSMGTLSGIACGAAGNLLERAADVTLKEFRPLVLVPRETPLNAIHLQNMLTLARMGVRIVPPLPLFYLKPATVAGGGAAAGAPRPQRPGASPRPRTSPPPTARALAGEGERPQAPQDGPRRQRRRDAGTARRRPGRRRSSVSKAIRPSRRARGAPRQ